MVNSTAGVEHGHVRYKPRDCADKRVLDGNKFADKQTAVVVSIGQREEKSYTSHRPRHCLDPRRRHTHQAWLLRNVGVTSKRRCNARKKVKTHLQNRQIQICDVCPVTSNSHSHCSYFEVALSKTSGDMVHIRSQHGSCTWTFTYVLIIIFWISGLVLVATWCA